MIESASPRPASILITAERRKSGFLPHRLITQMRERIGHHRVVPIKVPANGREYRKLTRILSLRQNLRAPKGGRPEGHQGQRQETRNAGHGSGARHPLTADMIKLATLCVDLPTVVHEGQLRQ